MKYLFKLHIFIAFVIVSGVIMSCENKGEVKTEKDLKIDSLTLLTNKQLEQIENLGGFISSIAETMDSINTQELEMIKNGNIERKGSSRTAILNNLKRYKETIQNQKEMISLLEKKLSAKDDEMSKKMLQIVEFYKKQLETKDLTIAKLQADIASNKRNISFLRDEVDNLTAANQELDNTIKEQDETLSTQTNMINKAYIKMGTKKELKAAGLLKGGLFSKKSLNSSNLREELFQEVDMRSCNDLLINSSKPQVLSPMPESSYTFVKDDKGSCYLHIISPNSFWSVSRFLVIQL